MRANTHQFNMSETIQKIPSPSGGEFYDGNLKAALEAGKKPLLHRIKLTEPKELISLSKLAQFYADTLVFKGTSSKIQSRGRWSVEPRFSLGQSHYIHALAPLAKAKIQRYQIKQLVAPGYGGMCALGIFMATGERFNWATVRVDGPKKERILTAFDGYLNPAIPVWVTDDYLASGHGAIKTMRVLRAHGYKIAGVLPVVADLTGNTGCRAFQTIGATMRFIFDYLLGLETRKDPSSARLVPIQTGNKAIYD